MKTKCLVFDALGGGEYRKQSCEGEVKFGYCAKHIVFYRSEVDKLSKSKEEKARKTEARQAFGAMLLSGPRKR